MKIVNFFIHLTNTKVAFRFVRFHWQICFQFWYLTVNLLSFSYLAMNVGIHIFIFGKNWLKVIQKSTSNNWKCQTFKKCLNYSKKKYVIKYYCQSLEYMNRSVVMWFIIWIFIKKRSQQSNQRIIHYNYSDTIEQSMKKSYLP